MPKNQTHRERRPALVEDGGYELGQRDQDHTPDSDLAEELPVVVALVVLDVPAEAEDVMTKETDAHKRDDLKSSSDTFSQGTRQNVS